MSTQQTRLPASAYHPDSENHFIQSKKEGLQISEVEQLFRAALMINPAPIHKCERDDGCGDKHKAVEIVVTYLKECDMDMINRVSPQETPAEEITSERVNTQISELIREFNERRKRIQDDAAAWYDDVYMDFREQKATADELCNAHVENGLSLRDSEKTGCGIEAIRVVDESFVKFDGKNVAIAGDSNTTADIASIAGFIKQQNGTIVSMFADDGYHAPQNADIVIGVGDGVEQSFSATSKETVQLRMADVQRIKQIYERHDELPTKYTISEKELDGIQSFDYFGFNTPIDVLAVFDKWNANDNVDIYPLIPWCGVVMCTCHNKHKLDNSIETLCEHEIYALRKYANSKINTHDDITLPGEFTRFSHSNAYKRVSKEIVGDEL